MIWESDGRTGTLIFEGDRRIDMGYVCPKDVKKMVVQQARSVYWKKLAAKHGYEESRVFGCSRLWFSCARKQKEDWKHRDVARKLVLEGGWGAEEALRHKLVG